MRASLAATATAAACVAALSITIVAPAHADPGTAGPAGVAAQPLPPEEIPDEVAADPSPGVNADLLGAQDGMTGGADPLGDPGVPMPDPGDVPDLDLPSDLPDGDGFGGDDADYEGYAEADVVDHAESETWETEAAWEADEAQLAADEATSGGISGQADAAGDEGPDGLAVNEGEPTVQSELNSLPAPRPGAEVYTRPSNGVFQVTGGGFGHGIGMSQYGAHGAGQQGRSHTQILAHYYTGVRIDSRNTSTIRVGITADSDGVTQVVRRSGLRISNAPGSTTYGASSNYSQYRVRATGSAASSCTLQGLNSAGTWVTAWPSGMQQSCPVTFSSTSEGTVDLVLPGGQQRIYRGSLTATHRGSTSLLTVNHVSVQNYLRSVTMAEMPTSFHQQALRAQSVAARTFALSGASSTAHYDVCDTTACQVYRGRGVRNSNGTITAYEHSNTDAAVSATNGQVMTYQFANGRGLITAMYSSSNGGHSADAPGVATHGYLQAKPDPYDSVSNNARHRWTGELPASTLQSTYGISRVERIQVLSRDGDGAWGGRVLNVRVEGFTAGGAYTYRDTTGTALRNVRPWPGNATGLSSHFFTFGSGSSAPAAERIAGANRYGTAAEASRAWGSNVSVVYVVSGQDYADALVAASRSGVYDAPVLLTEQGRLRSETIEALQRLRPQRIVVVGGTGAVSNSVYSQLRSYATTTTDLTMQRVSGGNRYETAAAMTSYYPAGQRRVYLASGENFPDALAAAALAAHHGAPLLLTRAEALDPSTEAQFRRLRAQEVIVVGGRGVVHQTASWQARDAGNSPTLRRVSGVNRYATAERVAREFPSGTGTAYVASGEAYPDALIGAAVAGNDGVPLVLTPRANRVDPATAQALTRVAPSQMFVFGGHAAVTSGNLRRLSEFLQ